MDLVNQRQLIALARGTPVPYPQGDEALLSAMRDFELAYEAYGQFQRTMERYWCLRWLKQEGVETAAAMVLREGLVRFDDLPLVGARAVAAGARTGHAGRGGDFTHRPAGAHVSLRVHGHQESGSARADRLVIRVSAD